VGIIIIRFSIIFSLFLITSCAVSTVTSAPEKDKFLHIDGTPAYVLIESDKSTDLINDDIYICLAEVEGKARSIKTPMKAVGGIYGVAGLLGIIDLATTGGIISSLLMPGMVVIAAAGWVTYASADAVSELGEYKNLETCLEKKDYSVVFFLEENKG
tara:strand:- start:2303 stop:2773 length:471 start_codon:yes stop_codon:yes gene_type:complete